MPRPVDPALRRARRLQLIDAGLTAFAEHGPGATTAQICRIAGIGSGTFFHHFPTKDSLLVAILEHGTEETREFFTSQPPDIAPRQTLLDYVAHAVADLTDPRAASFIAVVGALSTRPEIATALQSEDDTARTALREVAAEAQRRGEVRTDLTADRLAVWIMLLIDGFASRVAGSGFDAATEAPLLIEQAGQLLDGAVADPGSTHRGGT